MKVFKKIIICVISVFIMFSFFSKNSYGSYYYVHSSNAFEKDISYLLGQKVRQYASDWPEGSNSCSQPNSDDGYSDTIVSIYETLYDKTTGTIVANSVSKEGSGGSILKKSDTKIRTLAAAMALNKNINGVRYELRQCISAGVVVNSPTAMGNGKYKKNGYGGWSSAWRTTNKTFKEKYENYQTLQNVESSDETKTTEVTIDGGQYITMGPFKMKYGTATIKEIKINGTSVPLDKTKYILKGSAVTSYKAWNSSNSDYEISKYGFYILISKSRLEGLIGTDGNIKIEITQNDFEYERGRAFVCNDGDKSQGNVWYTHTSDTIPGGTATFSLTYTKDLTIKKEVKGGTNLQMTFKVMTQPIGGGDCKFLSLEDGTYSYNKNQSNATEFTTNKSSGEKILKNLSPNYKYCIIEIEAPKNCELTEQEGYATKINGVSIKGVSSGWYEAGVTIKMTNKANQDLTIRKTVEGGTNLKMTFVVMTKPIGGGDCKFLSLEDGTYYYKKGYGKATQFYTNKSTGEKILKNLSPNYKYCIIEIKAPTGCVLADQEGYKTNIEATGVNGVKSGYYNAGDTIEITNKLATNLTIQKKASHAKNSQMTFIVLTRPVGSTNNADIRFLQSNDEETYKYTVKKQNNATRFTTDESGSKILTNVSTEYEYCIVEISTPTGCVLTKQEGYTPNIYDLGINGVCSEFYAAGSTIKMTNTAELIKITVKKTWNDGGATSSRPRSVKVTLSSVGGKVINSSGDKSITTTLYTSLNYVIFDNLYRYDASGNLITYKIEEETVSGYTVSYSPQEITVNATASSYELKITNTKSKTTYTLQKLDDRDTTKSLKGVGFTITTKVWQYDWTSSQTIYFFGDCPDVHDNDYTDWYWASRTVNDYGWCTGTRSVYKGRDSDGNPVYVDETYTYRGVIGTHEESYKVYFTNHSKDAPRHPGGCWQVDYTENYYKWTQHTYYLTTSGNWVSSFSSNCVFYSDSEGKIRADASSTYYGYSSYTNDGTNNPRQPHNYGSRNAGNNGSYANYSTDTVTITEYSFPGDYSWMYTQKNSWTTSKSGCSDAQIKAYNHQTKVRISGFVWLDGLEAKGNVDNVFDKSDDSGLNGITVKLSDGQSTTTKELGLYDEVNGGEYQFYVSLDAVQNGTLYVTFEYCGITYQAVASKPTHVNDVSKAAETTSRQTLNNNFSSVTGNGSQTLTMGGTTVYYSNINDDNESTITSHTGCNVQATTRMAGYNIYGDFKPVSTDIRYINFGLYEKEQTDYEIKNEVYGAKVSINGYSHQYELSASEQLKLYSSDLDYDPDDSDSELKVCMTYKVTLKNKSSYNAKINSVVEYCDNRLKIVGAGTDVDGNGNITEDSMTPEYKTEIGDYKKYIIPTNLELKAGEEKCFYVQIEVEKNVIEEILDGGDLNSNIVEINSYTTHPKGTTSGSLAVLDTDSVPGNAKPDDDSTFEDDTSEASPVTISNPGFNRTLSGNVFVDSTGKDSSKVYEKQERKGDGIYITNEDTPLAGITVTMYEVDKEGKELDGGEKYDAVDTTSDDGSYTIEGYIPGNYVIQYTWGDSTYTVQNYKNTIYNGGSKNSDEYWYKTTEPRYSDAMDDEAQRSTIDAEISDITTNIAEDEIAYAYDGVSNKITYTTMDSRTPKMAIGVEYDNNTMSNGSSTGNFQITNIDFGIVERPKMQMELSKRVSTYKLTLSNGTVLARVDIDAEGNATGSTEDVSVISGLLKQEIDLELIYGATLEITYAFKVTNISELDYSNWDYYYYGTDKSNVVKLSATEVVDYLSNQLDLNADLNTGTWTGVTDSNYLSSVNASEDGDTTYLKTINLYTTDKLTKELEPGDSTDETSLYVSKLIGRDYDTSFNNKAEITKIDRTIQEKMPTGSPVITVEAKRVGYITFSDAQAQTVAIMPPTGGNNTEIYVIFGITMSVILIAGVIIIKIKILK